MKLIDIYNNHEEKVSDKWFSYINKYDELFAPYKDLPINLFEIGIQNGGSLEIYSKYFSKAQNIIGNDINIKCRELKFNDERIKLIVGDANEINTKQKILDLQKFDIIIDDGSHTSPDIIKSFANYFNHLKNGGLYIIEDLHCSYWKQFKGGLFFPISSISFFKKIIDLINHDHWGIDKDFNFFLKLFIMNYKINIKEIDFKSIKSIEFLNSVCVIKKEDNNLGKRIIKGKYAQVVPNIDEISQRDENISINQNDNPYSNVETLPEEEILILKEKLKQKSK